MKIAFDIDDVLSQFIPELLKFYAVKYRQEYREEDMKFKVHYGEIWGVDLERTVAIVKEFYDTAEFVHLPATSEALETLNQLNARNVEILAITSRPDKIHSLTLDWLKLRFGNLFSQDNVYFTNRFHANQTGKGDLCKSLAVDYFVEDDVYHIENCIKNGVKVIMLNKPWNKRFQDPTIMRINNLAEIISII